MKRREFIAGLGGAAAWPLATRAQQPRMRRVGALMYYSESDPDAQAGAAVLRETLEKLGWTFDRNLAIDFRWIFRSLERIRSRFFAEATMFTALGISRGVRDASAIGSAISVMT